MYNIVARKVFIHGMAGPHCCANNIAGFSYSIICPLRIDKRTYVWYYIHARYNIMLIKGTVRMDYKKLIIELLEKANKQQLKRLYFFIKGFLGLG